MNRIIRLALLVTGISASTLLSPAAADAQEPRHRQAISANPLGLLFEVFNAEYERVLTPTSTAGIGGSMFPGDEETYVNADAFWRYYPGERALEGWAFGVKAGVTHLPGQGTHPGFGFDLNRSWLLGPEDNFYVGVGFGLKRLLGVSEEDFDLRFVPTFRLINVGWAF